MFAKQVKIEYAYERTVWRLLAVVAGCLLIYGWLVAGVIFDAVAEGQLANRLERLESEVATLEAQYLGLAGSITLDLAYALGFEEATAQTLFVSAAAPTVAVAGL